MIGGIHPMMMTPVGGGGLKPQEVFAATAYTGNGANRAIVNGIDFSQGGMTWFKRRDAASTHLLFDTLRGSNFMLASNATDAQDNYGSTNLSSFNANGVSIGTSNNVNAAGGTFINWSFRRAAKFLDVVTYTGNGVAGRQIAHALGVAPGMVIVKRLDSAIDWFVWHRGVGNGRLFLNVTNAAVTPDNGAIWGNGSTYSAPTSADFTISAANGVNASGGTYVAYLFAHDTDASGIVQCGSFTTDGSGNATVNLGWRPQFALLKSSSGTSFWVMLDTARGWAAGADNRLFANASNAEDTFDVGAPISTGFTAAGLGASTTWIYAAIREPIF